MTYRGRMDSRTILDIKASATEFYDQLEYQLTGINAEDIYNVDEIPAYFDMLRGCTLHYSGTFVLLFVVKQSR